jgi:hypothetical protein
MHVQSRLPSTTGELRHRCLYMPSVTRSWRMKTICVSYLVTPSSMGMANAESLVQGRPGKEPACQMHPPQLLRNREWFVKIEVVWARCLGSMGPTCKHTVVSAKMKIEKIMLWIFWISSKISLISHLHLRSPSHPIFVVSLNLGSQSTQGYHNLIIRVFKLLCCVHKLEIQYVKSYRD